MTSRATGRKEDLWQLYNEVVYPPTVALPIEGVDSNVSDFLHGERRPAELTHRRENIMYSRKKLWLLGYMIRGLAVDDAFTQLAHRPEKGARVLEEVLQEGIQVAVEKHDFEYSSKIWIENVHVSRGRAVPRLYKGLRSQMALNNYQYTNLYIRLCEGLPPAVYHPNDVQSTWTPSPNCPPNGRRNWGSGDDMMHRELERIRKQRIKSGL